MKMTNQKTLDAYPASLLNVGLGTLLPCPFCGSKASVVFSCDDQNVDTYCVACDGCSCSIGEDSRGGAGDWADSHDFSSAGDSVAAWNKRSGDA